MNIKEYTWPILLGLVSMMLAWVLVGFIFPVSSVKLNTADWPVDALAVLNENSTSAVTAEQWSRIHALNREHNFLDGPVAISIDNLRERWLWLLLVPIVIAVVASRFMTLRASKVGVMLLPTCVLLGVIAFI